MTLGDEMPRAVKVLQDTKTKQTKEPKIINTIKPFYIQYQLKNKVIITSHRTVNKTNYKTAKDNTDTIYKIKQ
jgi:hypothetical protein